MFVKISFDGVFFLAFLDSLFQWWFIELIKNLTFLPQFMPFVYSILIKIILSKDSLSYASSAINLDVVFCTKRVVIIISTVLLIIYIVIITSKSIWNLFHN